MDSNDHTDIRGRIRAHGVRQLTLARLRAPEDWKDELRQALAMHRPTRSMWARDSEVRLFLESFAIFFTAAMIFLL